MSRSIALEAPEIVEELRRWLDRVDGELIVSPRACDVRQTLLSFSRWFGTEGTPVLHLVCGDMWKAYLRVVANRAGHALHISERFQIARHMGEAVDKVRRT